jgi:hypothetical protein
MRVLGRLIHLAIGATLLAGCGNDHLLFRGDGVLTDAGVTSYPRYQVAFPPISLRPGQETVFSFSGTPEATMWMGLVVMCGLRRISDTIPI